MQRACGVAGGAVRPSVTERLLEFGAVESQDYKADPENKGDHQRETASDEHSRHRRAPAGGRLRAERPPGSAIPVLQAVVGDPPALSVLPWHESIMKGRLIRLVGAVFSQHSIRATEGYFHANEDFVGAPCAGRCEVRGSARAASGPAR